MAGADTGAQPQGGRRQQRGKGKGQQDAPRPRQRVKKTDWEDQEVKKLEAMIAEGKPAPGTNPLSLKEEDTATVGYAAARTFEQLPMSRHTKDGLAAHKFETLTAIQRAALPHALAGRDILGAAKTGSGKTLAFLIPLVERLYRARWTRFDGLGALVLTPTRELALQIFLELRKVGKLHELSAGLLIGGKDVKEEQAAVNRMNILVATPGRLLQHMDETPGFDASNLQVLVLDEADRLLDMGFSATLDAILDALPTDRQTLLFSATQTKSVKDLARLSLSDPEYLSVHEASDTATPLKLQQAMAVVAPEHKMDVLWSFVRTHLASKIIVFLSTCKQVRFVYEAFRKLRPGISLRALHGGMKQMKRMVVFQDFCTSEHMVLFATDIAGRGLDFPSVDWVVQMDCPEDTATYIHRVGRTARYTSAGRALLLLTPREAEGMRGALSEAKIPVKTIKINPAKQQPIGPALQALLSKNTQLKEWCQRALVAYVRSVFLAPDKRVFDAPALPLEAIAASWGLLAAPRMRFLRKVGSKKQVIAELGDTALDKLTHTTANGHTHTQHTAESDRDASRSEGGDADTDTDSVGEGAGQGDADEFKQAGASGKASVPSQRGPGRPDTSNTQQPTKTLKAPKAPVSGQQGGDGDEDDFLVIKQRDVFKTGHTDTLADAGVAVAGLGTEGSKTKKRMKIKPGRVTGQRVVFGEDGAPLNPLEALANELQPVNTQTGAGAAQAQGQGEGVYVVAERPEARFNLAAQVMKQRDQEDKARLKALRAQMKAERKARQRAAEGADNEPFAVTLGGSGRHGSDEEEHSYDQGGGYGGHSEDSDGCTPQQHQDSDPGYDSDSDMGGQQPHTHHTQPMATDSDTSAPHSSDEDDEREQKVRKRSGKGGASKAKGASGKRKGGVSDSGGQAVVGQTGKKARLVRTLADQEAEALARIMANR